MIYIEKETAAVMKQMLLTAAVVVYTGIDMIMATLCFYLDPFINPIRFVSLTGKERKIIESVFLYISNSFIYIYLCRFFQTW